MDIFTRYSRLSPFPSIRAEYLNTNLFKIFTYSYTFHFLQCVRKMSSNFASSAKLSGIYFSSNIERTMSSCPCLLTIVLWECVLMTTNLIDTRACTYCRCKSSRRSRGCSSKRTTWFRPTRLSGGMFLHCHTEKSRKDSAGRILHTCCGLSVLWTLLCPRSVFFLVCQ